MDREKRKGPVMTKDGKLSKRDMDTLNRAWTILSRWSEIEEDKGTDADDYVYNASMNAVCGLCEFINSYEG